MAYGSIIRATKQHNARGHSGPGVAGHCLWSDNCGGDVILNLRAKAGLERTGLKMLKGAGAAGDKPGSGTQPGLGGVRGNVVERAARAAWELF